MADRFGLINAFLEAQGWGGAASVPLAGDASFRRYFRLNHGTRRAVLMDAPPPEEDVRPFLKVARHLTGIGYSAPQVLAEDTENGLLLLEDLGDETYTQVLKTGGTSEEALYSLAVDLLIDLHRLPKQAAIPKGLPPYGNGRLLDEALLLPQWTLPALTGEFPPEDLRRSYGEAWLSLFPLVHAQPKTLVLRDYHVDNLMWLPDRNGVKACGLLDFQDAVAGAAAYDLMSLLEDARRDIAPDLFAMLKERYFAAFPGLDRGAFETVFAILGAQRHAKVIGIFTRLCVRDGKPDYLDHIPRVWKLLEGSLQHPALTPVKDWFTLHVPNEMRGVPPCPAAKEKK